MTLFLAFEANRLKIILMRLPWLFGMIRTKDWKQFHIRSTKNSPYQCDSDDNLH
jgi:hypothetical protein